MILCELKLKQKAADVIQVNKTKKQVKSFFSQKYKERKLFLCEKADLDTQKHTCNEMNLFLNKKIQIVPYNVTQVEVKHMVNKVTLRSTISSKRY